jgi:hypothetical protein
MVTCGFELETQRTMGLNRASPGQPDEAAFQRAVNNEVESYARSLGEYLDTDLLSKLREKLQSGFATKWNRAEYTKPAKETVKQKMPKSVEVVEDGSVNGFEMRTIGPRSVAEFRAEVAEVFAVEHAVDYKCSFHIHVALTDVIHKYGANMQMALIDYILQHMDEVPAPVKERWAQRDWRTRYFNAILSAEKYTFVNKHGQGTWEFRCFGNINTVEHAEACLKLAVRAMQHAYAVATGKAALFVSQLQGGNAQWQQLCDVALTQGITLDAALAANESFALAI